MSSYDGFQIKIISILDTLAVSILGKVTFFVLEIQ